MQTVVMPFGKYKGQPLGEIPIGYLRWLIGSDVRLGRGFRRELEQELAGRSERRTPRTSAAVDNMPYGEPRVIDGIVFDDIAAGLLDRAIERGELVVTPDIPLSSPLPAAWLAWCRAHGKTPAVREITWDEVAASIGRASA